MLMRDIRKYVFVLFVVLLVWVVVSRETPVEVNVLVLDPISQGPNDIPSVVQVLNDNGYSVTHVVGEDVTVERLKNLGNADILIMRVHSSMQNDGVWVFSGEKYDPNSYVIEQLTNEVHRARASTDDEYMFAVGSMFFDRYISGVEGVPVLVMGCRAAGSRDLADIFLSKGATMYVSWDGPITLDYTDLVFSKILEYYAEGKTVSEAVDLTFTEYGGRFKL